MVEVPGLEDVPLRDVWAHEARDFTPWLAANPQHLAEALHMDLELEGVEVPVGPFWADVVLRDPNTAARVIVENFLEATDHDHLGKLITYAAGLDAAYAVLVAKTLRPEHRSALVWLNSISRKGSGFFGIEVHAVRIGSSQAAVKFDVVVEPDNWLQTVRAGAAAGGTVSQVRYREWWGEFLEQFHKTHPRWSNARIPQGDNWINFPTGRSGIRYEVCFAGQSGTTDSSLRTGLYMDDGAVAFPQLLAHRDKVESIFGRSLEWEELPDAKASRVALYLKSADPEVRENWPEYRDWAIQTVGRFREVFQTHVESLSA